MPIYKPSREFEGGDMSQGSYGRIFKEHVRVVLFNDEKNKNGNYFFILPAYKLDSKGQGVWFKLIYTRQDFGVDIKQSYVSSEADPVLYFENQAKIHFPDYCKVEEVTQSGSNQKRKRYPTFGRITKKVVYNTAYVSELNLGAHCLCVPVHYVGQTIESWGRTKNFKNELRSMINDPECATPVKLQLRKSGSVSGNPWLIEPDPTQQFKLPDQLADSDYLYNLDDVLFYPNPEDTLSKLKSITPVEIFDKCMKGYFATQVQGVTLADKEEDHLPGLQPTSTEKVTVITASNPVAGPTKLAPAFDIPKPTISATPVQAPNVDIPKAVISEAPKQAVEKAANATMTLEEAKAFLNQKTK